MKLFQYILAQGYSIAIMSMGELKYLLIGCTSTVFVGIDKSLELLSPATDSTRANAIVSFSPIVDGKACFFSISFRRWKS